jgi:hypothetical protein
MLNRASTARILDHGKVLDQFIHWHRHSPFVGLIYQQIFFGATG